jgi:ribonuclease HI
MVLVAERTTQHP